MMSAAAASCRTSLCHRSLCFSSAHFHTSAATFQQTYIRPNLIAMASTARPRVLHYVLRSEEDTADLACLLAESTQRGDAYLLEGHVGSGKSTFACVALDSDLVRVCMLQLAHLHVRFQSTMRSIAASPISQGHSCAQRHHAWVMLMHACVQARLCAPPQWR